MIKGSIVALITPMHSDGIVDWETLDALVDWHIENGTHGIVPVGTTGESATLDPDEHCDVIKRVVGRVNGRVPVIAGTEANATAEAIYLTSQAKNAGADACLLVTPYYNKPTQEGLYQHYKRIAEAVDIPQVLYNVPGRTACDMLADTVARLCKLPNIIGIKEATGDLKRAQEIQDKCDGDVILLSGDDATSVDLMLNGGDGTISVTANVAPRQMAEVADAAVAGDAEMANRLNAPLMALHERLFLEANPIPVKWALMEMGKISTGIRLPLTELSAEHHEPVRDALRRAGALN